MMTLLWIPATLLAVLTQTLRNATQRQLITEIGVVGATQVRFVYGLPFAALMLAAASLIAGQAPPAPDAAALWLCLGGALTQIAGTVLTLLAMRGASFAVATAYVKTEPVQVALFAALFLGDPLTPAKFTAVAAATWGVWLMSAPAGRATLRWQPMVTGAAAGAMFALSAVLLRGAIIGLPPEAPFYLRAGTMLVWSLAMQSVILALYLGVMDRRALTASFAAWRSSFKAGFLGAVASQFWFIGFSLTSAANVRTLGLLEVLLAQMLGRGLFAERTTPREIAGMALLVAGVGAILWLATTGG